jgi:hypothetical protein
MSDTARRVEPADGVEPPGTKPAGVATRADPTVTLVWPPPSIEIDDLEVVDLGAVAAAHVAGAPPVASCSLSEVVELDARSGTETYVLDLRTAEPPRAASGASDVATRDVPGTMPKPQGGEATTAVSTTAASRPGRALRSPRPALNWPPSPDEAEAITVVDLHQPDDTWHEERIRRRELEARVAAPGSARSRGTAWQRAGKWAAAVACAVGAAAATYEYITPAPAPVAPPTITAARPSGESPAPTSDLPSTSLPPGPAIVAEVTPPTRLGPASDASLDTTSAREEDDTRGTRVPGPNPVPAVAGSTGLARATAPSAPPRPFQGTQVATSAPTAPMDAPRADLASSAPSGDPLVRTPAATVAPAELSTSTPPPAARESAEPAHREPAAVADVSASAPTVTAPRAPSPAPSSAPAPVADETTAVRGVIGAYQAAYTRLDARAAAEVYPRLDVRALSRAFGDLQSQRVDFERCDIDVAGVMRARASCVGRAAFVRKVGSQSPIVEPRRWAFDLEKGVAGWRITRATITQQ